MNISEQPVAVVKSIFQEIAIGFAIEIAFGIRRVGLSIPIPIGQGFPVSPVPAYRLDRHVLPGIELII
jgi:hypothetical protein